MKGRIDRKCCFRVNLQEMHFTMKAGGSCENADCKEPASFQVLKERGRQNMKRSLELAEKLIHQSYLEKEEYMELLGSYQDKETVVWTGAGGSEDFK